MPELKPASASPLLGQLTPLPTTPVVPNGAAAQKRGSGAKPSLDDKIEYMDRFGVPRRSQTCTHRMVMQGFAIEMPEHILNEPDAPVSVADSEASKPEEVEESNSSNHTGLSPEELRQRNAEFKAKCKGERQQWIEDADKRIVGRLTLWYDGATVPADAEVVDVTEKNTATSPSKKAQAFIDSDGNLRRKSLVPQVAIKIEDSAKEDAADAEVRAADTASPPPPTAVPTSS